jgi:hypothetical protein
LLPALGQFGADDFFGAASLFGSGGLFSSHGILSFFGLFGLQDRLRFRLKLLNRRLLPLLGSGMPGGRDMRRLFGALRRVRALGRLYVFRRRRRLSRRHMLCRTLMPDRCRLRLRLAGVRRRLVRRRLCRCSRLCRRRRLCQRRLPKSKRGHENAPQHCHIKN